VVIHDRDESDPSNGRAVVVQDIEASPTACMGRLRDLEAYPRMVAALKSIRRYSNFVHKNGTERTSSFFEAAAPLGFKIRYFLKLTYEPDYMTYTWTLDYNKSSDFDDNVGHWQVMKHPLKEGWSRVLYSCEIKIFKWIPEFIVSFLTKTALVESTTWVKAESEEYSRQLSEEERKAEWAANTAPGVMPVYTWTEDGGLQYSTRDLVMDYGTDQPFGAAAEEL
jgi:hypothetical protein